MLSPIRHLLCESPRADLRIASALEFLRALPIDAPALIVAESQGAAQWLVAEALRGQTSARFAWHKRTWSSLAEELALPLLAREQRVVLRGLGTLGLCTRVVEQEGQRARLGRYARIARQPGFARALAATVTELRAACVTVAELRTHDLELSYLYEAYEAGLDELMLADQALVMHRATQAARDGSRFAGVPIVWLDVEIAQLLQSELVAALSQHAPLVCATVLRGDERSEAHLRHGLTHAQHELSVRRLEPQEKGDLARLQTRLFSVIEDAQPALERGGVRILSCPGESREAVEVVRAVLEAAARGVPFDRMAITLRAAEVYRAVIEEALTRAAIPAHFADGVRRPMPEGRALLLLLECAREGLSARAFAEYLSLSLAPRSDAETGDGRGRWQRLLQDACVGGSVERWLARLSALHADLTTQASKADPEGAQSARVHGDLLALTALQAFLAPLLPLLAALHEARTWGDYSNKLDQIARLALAEPDEVCEALRELSPLRAVSGVRLEDVQRVLSTRLSSIVVRSKGHGAGKLFVGTPDDLRGLRFEVVFALGLAEQLFPPRLSEDPLLPDRLRKKLSPELPLLEERAAHERLLLRVCVGAANRELVLSYPRFDLEHGRPRVPSFYGLEVLQAIDGTLPAFDELARRAEKGAAARMGFPAPEQAELAIDDAEFDLALLAELLRMTPQERAGGLRYLLSHHAHLARALRFRARRWTLTRFSAADGFVASDEASKELLAPHQLKARAYSASNLEQIAACPYRFYLQAILGLREREQSFDLAELDARERGVLMHRIQQATLTELRTRGLLPVISARVPEALAVLHAQFDRLSSEEKERRDPSVTRVLDESLRSLRHDLGEWLRQMPIRSPEWLPSYFELGFGVQSTELLDPHSVREPVAIEALQLKGVIDVVERHALRDERNRVRLRVTDHKSGTAEESNKRVITKGGTQLQPLLYGLALERLFPEATVSEGRLYFCTTRADFYEQPVPLDGEARALFGELLGSIDALLKEGFLPAAPAKDECARCAYLSVCGPYEEKERVPVVKAKDLARLAPLHRLRNLP